MESKIKYKYIFDKNYNPKYVNGAYGGINTRGEIIVNFFLERIPLPNSQSFAIGESGVGNEIMEDKEPKDFQNSFVRFVESGVVLTYENAKEIHRWLGDHIKKLEEISK